MKTFSMKRLFAFAFMAAFTLSSNAQDWTKIAMVNTYTDLNDFANNGDDDEQAAWTWLSGQGDAHYLPASDVLTTDLSQYKCLWLAIDRATGESAANLTATLKKQGLTDEVIAAIKKYYQDGGNLLLTNHACMAMTWFGRANVYPENYGSGAGSANSDVWFALLTYGKDPNAQHVLVHQEKDPLYAGLELLPTGDREDTWTIGLLGGTYKEDHNCFWHFDTSDFPVKIPYDNLEGYCDNGWYEKIGLVKDVYGVDMLATWSHINDFYGAAITRWNPIASDPYGKEEYKGTAIAIGIGGYEWNVNEGYNPYQENIELLTKNALKELAPTTTAINFVAVNAAKENTEHAYNLVGQRVGEGFKGLVIKDGKKVIGKEHSKL